MKFKKIVIDNMLQSHLTNKEVTFMQEIAKYQDDKGRVIGVYYRNIIEKCEICKQTFYNVKVSLEKKGLIACEERDGDYDIMILNNDFSYPESYKEGYVKLSRKAFDTKKYKNLKANEKLLLLHFLTITHENSGIYRKNLIEFNNKYMNLLGVTKRVLTGYLYSLKSFFSIFKKDGKSFIEYRSEVFEKLQSESEVDQYFGYIVRTGCRRNKVDANSITAVKDTLQLIKQYRQEAREAGRSIYEILNGCLAECRNNILNSKYIHKLIRQELGIEHRPKMGVQF